MTNRALALSAAALLVSVAAFAEIIELKGRGIVNATVLSENDKELELKDAEGKKYKVAKGDVVMRLEEQKFDRPVSKKEKDVSKPAAEKTVSQSLAGRTSQVNRADEMQRKIDDAYRNDPKMDFYRKMESEVRKQKYAALASEGNYKASQKDSSLYEESDSSSEGHSTDLGSLDGKKADYTKL